jgi:hypothetical protein
MVESGIPDGSGRDDALRRSERPTLSALEKYGPLAVIVAGIVAVVALLASTSPTTSVATTASTVPAGTTPAGDELPPGVESYPHAKRNGTAEDIDWGKRCDTSIGKVKMPLWPQPDCYAPFHGDNGGATEKGVTGDEISLVLYLPQKEDPVLKYIYQQIGSSDTPYDTYATYQGFVQIFNTYYETYGRKVVLHRFDATGNIQDSTAATTDAETIARDLAPFAVIGGPQLTNAFADTLASNHILCISCTPPQPASWYAERSPYVWDVGKNSDQSLLMVAEYLGKRLWNHKAEYAGDAALRDRKRVFGYIHVISSDSSAEVEERFLQMLKDEYGMTFAAVQTYESPLDLPRSGKDMITKMKEAGVTTVVFSGDPLAPQTLTQLATEQEYHPEWVLGPTVLVDTAVFSRTYDQSQWAHAFGPSGLFARTAPGKAGPGYVYKWYFGTTAPARSTVPLIAGPLQILYGAIQGLGPNLTHTGFRDVLFAAPINPSTPITPQVSFGNHGFFPDPDYAALDDQTEIWWDPDATGETELGKEGKGMWRYVEMGKRYLPGEWPKSEPKLFDPKDTVTVYDEPPPGTELPEYDPIHT